MLGQLQLNPDGKIRDKVQMSIELLKRWEPEEGFFVAFSGGKDSQAAELLCRMAGVKYDVHYSVTSADPPELVEFIKKEYPHVQREVNHFDDGKPEHYYPDGRPKPISMWNLIPDHLMPPTRLVRYCCEYLKEMSGPYRYTVTGVRWAESVNRKNNQGFITMPSKSKKMKKKLEENGVNFTKTNRGGWYSTTTMTPERKSSTGV